MLLNSFKKEPYDFHEAKFALAIAVDRLGEGKVSEKIVLYLSAKETGGMYQELYDSVKEKLASYRMGMVSAVIHYLWEEPVLCEEEVSNRTGQSHTKKSLCELLPKSSEDELYSLTMRLLSVTDVDHLIQEYVRTNHFKEHFDRKIKHNFRYSQDSIRENVLNDATLIALRTDFYVWVGHYSSNGSYDVSTCTPVPFLLHTFDYYVRSVGSRFYEILNTRGTASSLGGDAKLTLVDTVGISLNREGGELNFRRVCRQIYEASYLLFRHSDSQVAFYDIFSYHRDVQLEGLVQQKLPVLKKLDGCIIHYVDDTAYHAEGFTASIRAKKAGRVALCELLEDIVTTGVHKEDLYPLYLQLLQVTEKQTIREGARLFATASHKTKHLESNGQIFQILVNGYLALKELLNYLENADSHYSLNSFPVDIFRDKAYLRRFTSLEEYVAYIEDVRSMVLEVRSDSLRSKNIDAETGLYSNDSVYDIMRSRKLLNHPVFAELKSMPMGMIVSTVEGVSSDEHDLELYNNILGLRKFFSGGAVLKKYSAEALVEQKYGQLMSGFFKCTDSIMSFKGMADLTPEVCMHIIIFCSYLKQVLVYEGHDLTDRDGCFVVDGWQPVHEFFDYVEDMAAAFCEKQHAFGEELKKNYLRRVLAVHVAYKLLFGIDKMDGFCCTMWDLRCIMVASELFREYFCRMYETFGEIYMDKSDLYLILVKLARSEGLLHIPRRITSCDDISFLCGSVRNYWLGGDRDAAESLAVNEEKNKNIVTAFNRLFAGMEEQLDVFQDILERSSQCIKESPYVMDVTDRRVAALLVKADRTIMGLREAPSMEKIRLTQRLEAMAEFDRNGYAMLNRRLYTIDTKRYLHRSGYVVLLDLFNGQYELEDLTVKDLDSLDGAKILGA